MIERASTPLRGGLARNNQGLSFQSEFANSRPVRNFIYALNLRVCGMPETVSKPLLLYEDPVKKLTGA